MSHVEAAYRCGTGAAVLDIGGAQGAAVVCFGAEFDGVEVEIRRAGAVWDGTHTAVHARELPRGVLYAAVFGSLAEGSYQVRLRGFEAETRVVELAVSAASATHIDWPGPPKG